MGEQGPQHHVLKEYVVKKDLESERTLESAKTLLIEEAYKKAIATETDLIRMDDFKGVYGEAQVKTDQERVERLEAVFHENEAGKSGEGRRLAKILEIIVIEQIELNEWLGPGVDTMQASKIDDYVNGIDFLAFFKGLPGFKPVRLAVDATYGGGMMIQRKMEDMRSRLNRGKLGEVYYYQTPDKKNQRQEYFVPKVVLAVDREHLLELADLWVKGDNAALKDHPMKRAIVGEMLNQLEAQLRYALAIDALGNVRINTSVEALVQLIAVIRQANPREEPVAEPETEPKEVFKDFGARLVGRISKEVFAPSNVLHIEVLDLKREIAKRLRLGHDVSDLQEQYKEMLLQQVKDLPTRKELLARMKELNRLREAGEEGLFAEMSYIKQELTRLNEIARILHKQEGTGMTSSDFDTMDTETLLEEEKSAPTTTREILIAQIQELQQKRKEGDETATQQIRVLEQELKRLKELRKIRAVLEQRRAREKQAKQNPDA